MKRDRITHNVDVPMMLQQKILCALFGVNRKNRNTAEALER